MSSSVHDPRVDAERRALRLGRWCRAALEVSAGVGYSAFLLVQAKLAARDPATHGVLQWIAVGALIGLPLFPASLDRVLGWFGPRARRFAWVLQALPLILLDTGETAHLVLGPLVLLQGNLLVRSGDDKLASWCLALGPVQVLCGMAFEPSPEWLLLFPLSILAAVAALSLLLARNVEEDMLERAPRVLLRHVSGEERRVPREWTARLWRALPLATLVLIAVVPFYVLVTVSRAPFASLWNSGAQSRLEERQARREARRPEDGPRRTTTNDAVRQFFPENLTYGRGGRDLRHRAVMQVRPSPTDPQRGRPRSLYMRGLVLDEFGPESADFAGGVPLVSYTADAEGWTRIAEPSSTDLLELEVIMEPLFIGDTWSNVLFAPHPLLAIGAPEVRYHENDRLTLPIAPQETILYELLVPYPETPRVEALTGSASHGDPRYIALPPRNEATAFIADRAREVTRGARTDGEKVRRVLNHFRADYAYSLDARNLPGIDGVTDFMQRKEGHCTSFSVAAVLMLRSLGISSRVATGYLASDWLEDEESFLVTTRNGHAWIEVWFPDRGWFPLDPTPPARREAALAAADAETQPTVGTWMRELRENVVFWSSTGGHDSYLRGFFETLARGPAVLFGALRNHPGPASLLGIAALLLWAWFRSGRPAPGETALDAPPPGELAGPYRRLLRALAARGYPRRPSQTLHELALAAAHAGGAPFEPLSRHVAVLYRARFGDRPPTPEEKRALEQFVEELEREPARTAHQDAAKA